jgi:hypothetical protein
MVWRPLDENVLSPECRKIVHEQCSYEEPYGLFWSKARSGLTSGPGFKAFAVDFPAGTILRVTAEIIFPESSEAAQ